MTSEIAVMNQRAVALAADSAVTLIDGGNIVIRNDQQKLFNLVEGQPVGLMFFGVADIMGHPWDHLIEHYKKKIRPSAPAHLNGYARSFLAMFDGLDEFFPCDKQGEEYTRLVASVFRFIFHFAQYLRDSGEGGEGSSDEQVLAMAIDRVWHDYQFKSENVVRPDLPCFPAGFAQKVANEYGALAQEIIDYGFGQFQLGADTVQKLRQIAIFAVVKDLFLEDVTGLVFGGFGSDDRYPVCATWFASAIVGGILKRAEIGVDAIDTEMRSKIRVFADSEVTNAFIRGIDFNLERRLYGGFRMIMHGLVDHLIQSFPDVDPGTRETVRDRFQQQFVPQYFSAFHRMISEYQQQAFINPILRVLEIAGRHELAETARELVSLNIFKKRIMAQRETVGGAVAVAVISREGGFQWSSQ